MEEMQYYRLPEWFGQSSNARLHVGFGDQHPLGTRVAGVCLRDLDSFEIINREYGRRTMLAYPRKGNIAHDRHHPWARATVDNVADSTECTQTGFLQSVLCIGVTARDPVSQCVGIGEMRQHQLGKARMIVILWVRFSYNCVFL